MSTPVKNADLDEMAGIASELFNIIPGVAKAIPVPAVQAGELKEKVFKRQFVDRNKPVLIKGAVRHWPAVNKWRTPEYWIANCKNEPRRVIPHMNYSTDKRRASGSETMPFHDAIRRLFSGKDRVLSIPSEPVAENNLYSGVIKDLADFSFLSRRALPLADGPRALFIYRRAATAWHVHYCDETLMCQVNGAKQVILLPPDMPRASYVTEFLEHEQFLKGEQMDPSLELRPHGAIVEEGDALYIPPHWFHCVVPRDGEAGFTSLTVFRSPWHIYGNLFSYFVRRTYKILWQTAPRQYRGRILRWGCYAVLTRAARILTGNR